MELLLCLVVHLLLLLPGVRGLLCLFSLENPRLPALSVGTGMPSPSISQESTTSITCLLDCWGRKGQRRRDWGSGQALLSWEQEGIGRQGASQGLWPEKGGSVPAHAGKRVRKTYSCSSFCPTHFALFLIYCHQVEYDSQALTPQVQRGQNAASSGCLAVLVP